MRALFLCFLLSFLIAPVAAQSVTGGRVACESGTANGYPCEGVDLMSFLSLADLDIPERALNDVWGWADFSTSREFAIVGALDGTIFVDVTDPLNPELLGILPTQTSASSWRDVKVYGDHALIVSEARGHGLQVFDLTQLRDVSSRPATFTPTAVYDRFGSAHNIVVNEESGFAYAVGVGGTQDIPDTYPNPGSCGAGLHIVDVRDPANPSFAGCHLNTAPISGNRGYVHDAQCVIYEGPDADYQGREVCFSAVEAALGIADVTDKEAPTVISTTTYPQVAYAHQGWLSSDQRYFFLGDELDESSSQFSTRTLVWDLQDLDDPELISQYFNTGVPSIDHNQYVLNNYLFQANYRSGLRILDVSDPSAPTEIGYFDTYPANDFRGYDGAWSNYPYLPSGNILISSIDEGLFVVQPNDILVANEDTPALPEHLFLEAAGPNPFRAETAFQLHAAKPQQITVRLYDVLGREVSSLFDRYVTAGEQVTVRVPGGALPAGTYFVRVEGERTRLTRTVQHIR